MTIHDLGCSRKREHMLFSMEYKMLVVFLLSDVDSVFSEFVSQPEMRSLYLNSTELFFIIIDLLLGNNVLSGCMLIFQGKKTMLSH